MQEPNIKALLIADCYPESNKRGHYIKDPKLLALLIKHLHDQNPKELLIFGGVEGKMTATDEEQLKRLYPVPAEPKQQEQVKAEPAKSSEISASSRSFFGSTATRQGREDPKTKPVEV